MPHYGQWNAHAKEQLEKRIQRRVDTITAAQMVGLRKIYNSLKDGMSTRSDWFEIEEANGETVPTTGVAAAKEALKKKTELPTSEELFENEA